MTVAAPVVCPSIKMAAFTAQTNATMVTIAASTAAQSGLALKRRTEEDEHGKRHRDQRNAKLAGQADEWSISAGNSGVRMPEMMPPAATMSSCCGRCRWK